MAESKSFFRWKWIVGAIIALAIMVLVASRFVEIKPVYPEYNIVLVSIDTTRADRLGCYGWESAKTPNIDLLADQGIRFTNCYTTNPITLPAHTSMMTGLYPFRHGLRDNNAGRLSADAETLAEILKTDGYKTGAVVGAYVLDSRFGLDQGFDYYDDEISRADKDSQFHIPERKAGVVTGSALKWLDGVGDSKYFLWLHYFDPHANYAPPGVDLRGSGTPERQRQLYDMEIAYVDAQLGRIVERVGKIQQSTGRPTMIIVTSDHGESLGDHGEPTHGMTLYNATMRAPLVIFDSAEPERGQTNDDLVSIVDIMPTLVNRLGLKLSYEIDGCPLPGPAEPSSSESDSRAVYFESMMPFNFHGWSPLEGIVRQSDKLIVAPKPEGYDLTQDGGETKNLYQDGDPRFESLHTALDELKDAPLKSLGIEKATRDRDAIRKLASLGYIGTEPEANPTEIPDDLPNPKDCLPLHREFLSAQNLVANGRTERALEKLSWVILQDPDNKAALNLIPDGMTNANPPFAADKVIELLNQLMKMRPESDAHALTLGKAHVAAQDMTKAMAAFDKAIELNGDNAEALNYFAWFSYKQGQNLDIAKQRSQRAVEIKPEDHHMLHTLACILLEQNQPTEAIKQLDAALAIDSDFAIGHYHLGIAYQQEGNHSSAIDSYEQAIQLVKPTAATRRQPAAPPEWLTDAEQRLAELESTN